MSHSWLQFLHLKSESNRDFWKKGRAEVTCSTQCQWTPSLSSYLKVIMVLSFHLPCLSWYTSLWRQASPLSFHLWALVLTPSLSIHLTDNPLLFQMQGLHTGKRQKDKSEFKRCFEKIKAFHLSTTPTPQKLSSLGFIKNVLKPWELHGTWLGLLLCLRLQEGSRLSPTSMKTKGALFSEQTQAAWMVLQWNKVPGTAFWISASDHLDGESENKPLWMTQMNNMWKTGYTLYKQNVW